MAAPNTGSSPLRYAPGMLRDGHIRSAPWPSPLGQAVQAAAYPYAALRPLHPSPSGYFAGTSRGCFAKPNRWAAKRTNSMLLGGNNEQE